MTNCFKSSRSYENRLLWLQFGFRFLERSATYYRGIIRHLHERGHQITFYEPDAYQRQEHRDFPEPDWARVVVYEPTEKQPVG